MHISKFVCLSGDQFCWLLFHVNVSRSQTTIYKHQFLFPMILYLSHISFARTALFCLLVVLCLRLKIIEKVYLLEIKSLNVFDKTGLTT